MVQLYALNDEGMKLFVENACKGEDYSCLECGQLVRLRGGVYHQLHFYHIDEGRKCTQREKTIEHILVQKHLQDHMYGVQLEVRLPAIGRIADALWQEEKIVFEVQVSPMTEEECLARIADYKKLGFDVVFILHVKTYGRRLATPMECVLEKYTHYFTDIDEHGGDVFDMLSWVSRRRRLFLERKALSRCVIDIATIERTHADLPLSRLKVLQDSQRCWLLQASGDLLSKTLSTEQEKAAIGVEQWLYSVKREQASMIQRCWQQLLLVYRKLIECCV